MDIRNLIQQNINEVNYTFMERIIKTSFENSSLKLQGLIVKIITTNHRLDKIRQRHIELTLKNFIKSEEQDVTEYFKEIRYNGMTLNMCFNDITDEHRYDFITLITTTLFDESLTQERVLFDCTDIIKNHFKSHVIEALNYINTYKHE
jgi:hypothetical protein